MAERLRISVVVPVYNGERFVAEALGSVLSQTRAPDEVIVVDDGSTDGTADILAAHRAPGLIVIRQENRGAGVARNHALDRCAGDLVAFLDADDLWLPGALAASEAAFMSDLELEITIGHVRQFQDTEADDPGGASVPGYLISCMTVRRSALERLGRFETDPGLPEVALWFIVAQERGARIQILPEVVARRRLHSGNRGRTVPHIHREYVLALKRSLDRRRAAASSGQARG